jgi:predicted NBD/HSP70 family sugar kinase
MPYRTKKINAPKMGKSNRLLILNLIRSNPGITRRILSRLTGLDPSTVTNIIFSLLSEGLVQEEGAMQSTKPGRKSISLKVVKEAAISINLVFGTQQCVLGLGYLDNSFDVLDRFPTDPNVDRFLETVFQKVHQIRLQMEDRPITSFSVSLPGMADQNRQVMVNIPHLHWEEVDLLQFFVQKDPTWSLPILLANEAQLALTSEINHNPSIKEFSEGLYIFISEGVGGALMIDGQLYRGPSFSAGEVGHMSINTQGPPCYCLNRGCWEETISVSYAVQTYEQLSGPLPQEMNLFEKFVEMIHRAQKDSFGQKVLDQMAKDLSTGIVNLCNILNPSFVMLGGMGDKLPDSYVKQVESQVKACALKPAATDVKVLKASLDILSACSRGCTLQAMNAYTNKRFQ